MYHLPVMLIKSLFIFCTNLQPLRCKILIIPLFLFLNTIHYFITSCDFFPETKYFIYPIQRMVDRQKQVQNMCSQNLSFKVCDRLWQNKSALQGSFQFANEYQNLLRTKYYALLQYVCLALLVLLLHCYIKIFVLIAYFVVYRQVEAQFFI